MCVCACAWLRLGVLEGRNMVKRVRARASLCARMRVGACMRSPWATTRRHPRPQCVCAHACMCVCVRANLCVSVQQLGSSVLEGRSVCACVRVCARALRTGLDSAFSKAVCSAHSRLVVRRTHARTHTHARMHTHTHARTRTHACTHTRTHAHARMHTHARARTHAHARTRTRVHTYTPRARARERTHTRREGADDHNHTT
jgi:hypothetical protein